MSTARIIDSRLHARSRRAGLGALELDACGEAVLSSPSMTQSERLAPASATAANEFDTRDGSVDLRRRAIPAAFRVRAGG